MQPTVDLFNLGEPLVLSEPHQVAVS